MMSNDLTVIREPEEETGLTFSNNNDVSLAEPDCACYSQDANGNVCRLVINEQQLAVFTGLRIVTPETYLAEKFRHLSGSYGLVGKEQ